VSGLQSLQQCINAGLNEFLIFFVLPDSFNNIFNPLFRRVGCFCFSLERQRDRYLWTRGKTQRSKKVAGRESRLAECQNVAGFSFGPKAAVVVPINPNSLLAGLLKLNVFNNLI
jgi:hypothetical protein